MSDLQFFTRPANTCTCPLKEYAIKNISELYVIPLPPVILSKALVLYTRPTGRVLWEELLVLSRFHS